MVDFTVKASLEKEKIMLKSRFIKSNHRVRKHRVDTYGAPVFTPDYSVQNV
jgi:hypothetical protein